MFKKFVTGMFQGAKTLDGACYAGLDLTPPHANVNPTTPWAQDPLPDVDQTTRRHRAMVRSVVIYRRIGTRHGYPCSGLVP